MPEYLLLRDLIQSGPFTLEEMRRNGIKPTDLIWVQEISTAWRYSGEIQELKDFLPPSDTHVNFGASSGFSGQHKNFNPAARTPEGKKEDYRYMPEIDEKRIAQNPSQENGPVFARKQEPGMHQPSPPYIIKVIIVDDHTLFREGVKMALSQKTDVKIVGEAENGMQLMHLLKHSH